jgi:uncharacterized repeat protein (TIGR03803 family)
MRLIKSYIFASFFGALLVTCVARAQTFKVLHTFTGAPNDGEAPLGTLVRDAAGNLYGTTELGGSRTCGQFSCGTVFMLNNSGEEVGVFSFNGQNGTFPVAGVFRDASGNLYGTTQQGGAHSCNNDPPGCGTVFQLNKAGTKIRYYSFAGSNGEFPDSTPVEVSGSLYGTTSIGGSRGFGTVYRINSLGKESVLHSFKGESDGCDPEPGITTDSKGNLYGVAYRGGFSSGCNGDGTAYELDTAGNFTVLYKFIGAVGANPESLILDSQGNLYGTAVNGGSSEECSGGCGTVFELSPQNGTWSGRSLYSFCSLPLCADGQDPRGPLVLDNAGNIYGVTTAGGGYTNCGSGLGCGTIFKIDPSGNETVLYNFTGGLDGANPFGGLIMDASGNLYGTTTVGGDLSCDTLQGGCGVVFELTP